MNNDTFTEAEREALSALEGELKAMGELVALIKDNAHFDALIALIEQEAPLPQKPPSKRPKRR